MWALTADGLKVRRDRRTGIEVQLQEPAPRVEGVVDRWVDREGWRRSPMAGTGSSLARRAW